MNEKKTLDKYNDTKFNLFQAFNEIQDLSEGYNLLEVSLRQGQIMFIFEENLISLFSFEEILDMVLLNKNNSLKKTSSIGFIENNPILVLNTTLIQNEGREFTDLFSVLIGAIEYAAENVCKCPALEIIFSSQYIKCFLDKPGITLEDVQKYEEMFNLKGTLELFGQRPYLLLINDNFQEE